MPKLKTNRGAAKRFKKTGTGKIKAKRAFARHILTKKADESKTRSQNPEVHRQNGFQRDKEVNPLHLKC